MPLLHFEQRYTVTTMENIALSHLPRPDRLLNAERN